MIKSKQVLLTTDFCALPENVQTDYEYSILYTKDTDFILSVIDKLPYFMLIDLLSLLEVNYDLYVNKNLPQCICQNISCVCECTCNVYDLTPNKSLFKLSVAQELYLHIVQQVDIVKHYTDFWYRVTPYPEVEKYIFEKLLPHEHILIDYAHHKLVKFYGTGVLFLTDEILILHAKMIIGQIINKLLLTADDCVKMTDYKFITVK